MKIKSQIYFKRKQQWAIGIREEEEALEEVVDVAKMDFETDYIISNYDHYYRQTNNCMFNINNHQKRSLR